MKSAVAGGDTVKEAAATQWGYFGYFADPDGLPVEGGDGELIRLPFRTETLVRSGLRRGDALERALEKRLGLA